ncbi:hypothetical protein [Bacillus cereus group sp. TH152-1LC]|uniref:hypothetical protein n=1 Tax=Bacillus cereus group sp. TH152-1LC TaxID=3018060 RepID=UPI0022E71484|nr:hypothetical protein [Bacillus cereus group sp. TH152-1LC]MDA1675191.1 hypothetical protein [Bacillus cereus group sp. TH152-1LC]
MQNKGIASIDMMAKLMKESNQIRLNHQKETNESKDELLKKAKAKMNTFFENVLESLPLNMVNVSIEGIGLNIYIRKNSLRKENFDYLKNESSSFATPVTEIPDFVIININPNSYNTGDYYSLNDDWGKWYWAGRYVQSIEEKQLIFLIQNFKEIKKATEETILEETQKRINHNSQILQQNVENIEVLNEFIETEI